MPGYLDRHPRHTRSLAIAIAVHAGLLAAILTVRTVVTSRPPDEPTVFAPIADPPAPPPPVAHPQSDPKQPRQPDRQPRTADLKPDSSTATVGSGDAAGPIPPWTPPPLPPGPPVAVDPVPEPVPVLTAPAIDPRFARDLQPPYPSAMERIEQEGSVTVRVQIGADGRVIDVELVRTDADEFFTATKAWALRKWRFRPATRDGEAVVSWLTKTVQFRIVR